MVTRIKESEKHQTSKDMVSVLDFRLIEVWEHFPFTLFHSSPRFRPVLLFYVHWLKLIVRI